MEINKKLTPYNFTRMGNKITKYIVIHYVGAVSTAKNNADYYAGSRLSASAHYFVDENEIWQSVDDNNAAWHCGGGLQGSGGHSLHGICKNSNSIGIEMCVRKSFGKWYFKKKTIKNTVELVRYLMEKYNIPIENVIRHYDVTGKICPEPFVNESKWAKFKAKTEGKESLTMNQYKELKRKIEALEQANKVYHYWNEIPEYAYPVIKELYDRGIYKGNGPSDLNLPDALMRTLVINYRAGLYTKDE